MYLVLYINVIFIVLTPIAASLICIRDKDTCIINKYHYDPKFSLDFEIDPVSIGPLAILSFNNSIIVESPDSICKHLNLVRIINFTDTQMYRLASTTFNFCTNLQGIILKGNFLSDLPDAIFNGVDYLMNIDLSYNLFTQINGNAFKNLKNLLQIDLSHNQLIIVPSIVFPVSLRHLDLSFNQLTSFSASQLKNMETLNLNNNALTVLTLNTNIRTLKADNNYLQSSSIFANSPTLVNLSLKNNSFNNFDAIRNLPNEISTWLYLDLSENPMQNITWNKTEEPFTKCSKLKRFIFQNLTPFHDYLNGLDISSNNLTSIYFLSAIPRLSNIKYLKLNNNNLSLNTFKWLYYLFPELNVIDISENNWNCNNLKSVIETIDKLQIEIIIDDANLNKTGRNIRGIRCSRVTESLNDFHESELITTLDPTTLINLHEIENTQDDHSDAEIRKKIDELQIIISKLLQHIKCMRLIITILVISIGIMLTIFIFSLLRKKVNCNNVSTNYNRIET